MGPIEFMVALYYGAKYDFDKCPTCGGIGLVPEYCCSGQGCGCQSMPVDYIKSECDCPEPTNEQLIEWYHNAQADREVEVRN